MSVVRVDQTRVTVGHAAMRELVLVGLFGYLGGLLVVPALLDYLWPHWSKTSQAIHDPMAETFVVRA